MKIRLFYHSLRSDWNHGNAHFLRGICTELVERGHDVLIYEPADGWSLRHMLSESGDAALRGFHATYPLLQSVPYDLRRLDLDEALAGADLVIVHEWNEPDLVRLIGEHHSQRGRYCLFFHDTHHRLVSNPDSLRSYGLEHYDGVLAYGGVLSELYRRHNLVRRVWTWHEAADTRVFRPLNEANAGDVVWVGNWGDGERTAEIEEFLIGPVRRLGLRTRVYGVRYPQDALAALQKAGIEYAGWLPNFEVPSVFAQFRLTIHIPRRPYVEALPGIPTIRPFEALACGIPLVSSFWRDVEHLFTPQRDFLTVHDGAGMERCLARLLSKPEECAALANRGLATIRRRHTCAHRVSELLQIFREARSNQEKHNGHRLLRIKPRLRVLEWRRDLLPRTDPRAP